MAHVRLYKDTLGILKDYPNILSHSFVFFWYYIMAYSNILGLLIIIGIIEKKMETTTRVFFL